MTPMAKTFAATLLVAPLALPSMALAQTQDGLAYETMIDRMKLRQTVTQSIIDLYDSTEVVEDTSPGDQMQSAAGASLISGQPVPEGVELTDAPEEVAAVLPELAGAEWRRAGDHLVAVTDDNVAAVVVWEVMP